MSTRCDLLCNLDSDVIVKPNFLSVLLFTFLKFKPKILTGYNSVCHESEKQLLNVLFKKSCGGVNLVFQDQII